MRNIPIVSLLFYISLASCRSHMDDKSTNDTTPVIRTDFTDGTTWKKIQSDISASNQMGFSANVRFIDETRNSGLTGQELLKRVPGLTEYGCVFVADATSMPAVEHHLLVLDLSNPKGRSLDNLSRTKKQNAKPRKFDV